ncbi:hypothetical protein LMG29542_08700 [Paraburkholderia humisilvae]|uniref:Transposase IS30-like HTH domain-containing protein n=1 Tax=Paraburkholderia humisilvae TaxID=627669 RepID=A0A6J5F8V4_9BURK|nr:hypothetical protein LMG29542_08700 [Paraburkholderia humisilvae]
MARILGRSPATVSRELTRNSCSAGYASVLAEAFSAARRSAGRRPAKLCLQGVCWRVVLTLLEWKWSPQQISATLIIRPTRPSRFHTKPSTHRRKSPWGTRPSMPSRVANCAVSSLRACATATARACRAHGAMTGADRFPTWSAFICERLKSKTDCCLDTGKAISSKVPATSPPSAFWSNGPAAWCCLPGWKTPPPRPRWRASLPNSIRLPHHYGRALPTTRAKKCRGIRN